MIPLLRDKYFWAALLAAFPFWVFHWLTYPPSDPIHFVAPNLVPFLMISIAYPVVEEIIFRGALQGYLIRRLVYKLPGPISSANISTSVAFASLHGIVLASSWSLLVFFPSLVYGYFRERTGGLIAPLLLHIFYNSGFFIVLAK